MGESFQQGTVWASEAAWALKIAHWRERVKVTEALKSLYSRGNQNCRMRLPVRATKGLACLALCTCIIGRRVPRT